MSKFWQTQKEKTWKHEAEIQKLVYAFVQKHKDLLTGYVTKDDYPPRISVTFDFYGLNCVSDSKMLLLEPIATAIAKVGNFSNSTWRTGNTVTYRFWLDPKRGEK